MKQQTAVEWLDEHLNMLLPFVDQETADVYNRLIEQAKEMEMEQIKKAHHDGYYREDLYDTRNYYNDTYGTNNQ